MYLRMVVERWKSLHSTGVFGNYKKYYLDLFWEILIKYESVVEIFCYDGIYFCIGIEKNRYEINASILFIL